MTTTDAWTRRQVLKATAASCLTAATGGCGLVPRIAPAANRRPPNIVLILADDMGYSDLGCFGSEISTPHLDSLASRGVRFRHMYNCARCCPTRAALLTGLYPAQTGVGYMWKNMHADGYEGYLNDRSVTIAQALRDAGYRTMLSGKWHVGKQQPHWPAQRGFDDVFSLIGGAADYWGAGSKWVRGNDSFKPGPGFYATDAITEHAQEMLAANSRRQPFFLYLAYNAPHWPLHAPRSDVERYLDRYRAGWTSLRAERCARMRQMGVIDANWTLPAPDPETTPWNPSQPRDWEALSDDQRVEMSLRMAVYAAMVDRMDQGIGRIVRQIRALGQEDNTLFIFLSDNGASAETRELGQPGAVTGEPGSYVAYGLDWAAASNTPFRRYKRWTNEGGIATSMILSWPAGVTRHGGWCDVPAHIVDVMPTCLEAAGAVYPQTRGSQRITPMEGRSLLQPARRDVDPDPRRLLCWEHEGHSAARQGRWKIVFDENTSPALYDLQTDRTETRDLATERPDQTRQLLAGYERWASRTGVVAWSELLAREQSQPGAATE